MVSRPVPHNNADFSPFGNKIHNGSHTLEDWRQALEGVKPKRGGGYMALCPAHDDKNPSLSVDQGDDGKILVKCFAGCEYEDVCAAAGLETPEIQTSGARRPKTKKPPKIYTTRAVYSGRVFEFKAPSGEILYVQRHKGPFFPPRGGR